MAAALLPACSGPGRDDSRAARDAATEIDAAALVRAYAQDPDEADARFAGRPLVVAGDVVRADPSGRLVLTTGDADERLAATVVSSPHPVSPRDRVSMRCERLDRNGSRPRVARCTFLAIIPARIAGR